MSILNYDEFRFDKIVQNPGYLENSGELLNRVKFSQQGIWMNKDKCGDCGCKVNELHEVGCDLERCPVCGGQLVSCNCICIIRD